MVWISVEDRLPADYEEVLFFATTNENQSREIMTGHRERGLWLHCCLFYASARFNEDVKITHWMELPDYPNIGTVKVD